MSSVAIEIMRPPCSLCHVVIVPDDAEDVNLWWPYLLGPESGIYGFLHKACTHAFDQRSPDTVGTEEIRRILRASKADCRYFPKGLCDGIVRYFSSVRQSDSRFPTGALYAPSPKLTAQRRGEVSTWLVSRLAESSHRAMDVVSDAEHDDIDVYELEEVRIALGVCSVYDSTGTLFWNLPPRVAAKSPRLSPSRGVALRYQILKRDAYRCRLCGIAADDGSHVRLEVDHITPRAKGGNDDPINLWTLCFACNRGKGTQEL